MKELLDKFLPHIIAVFVLVVLAIAGAFTRTSDNEIIRGVFALLAPLVFIATIFFVSGKKSKK